jgi:hypothetical protein
MSAERTIDADSIPHATTPRRKETILTTDYTGKKDIEYIDQKAKRNPPIPFGAKRRTGMTDQNSKIGKGLFRRNERKRPCGYIITGLTGFAG